MQQNVFKKKTIGVIFIFFMLTLLQSCYTYKIKPDDITPASQPQSMIYRTYFWGNIEGKKKPKPECHRNGLAEVEVHCSFGQSLITILTLGIYHPVKITWTCHQCLVTDK